MTHVQSCSFANLKLLLFAAFRCRFKNSILLWSRIFATMVTWHHTSIYWPLQKIPEHTIIFFRLSFRNCKSCVCNCDDHPSLNSSLRSSHFDFYTFITSYHNNLCLSPPTFCISIVFSFSWELKWSQEKLKTLLMLALCKSLGWKTKSTMVCHVVVNCSKHN